MRYTVGQIYVFATLENKENSSLFKPWFNTLKRVDFFVCECIEHRRVPDQTGPEPKHDGWIFKLLSSNSGIEPGVLFFNQYPMACFNQDTDDDWKVYPDLSSQIPAENKRYLYKKQALQLFYLGITDVSKIIEATYKAYFNPIFQAPEHAKEKAALLEFSEAFLVELKTSFGLENIFHFTAATASEPNNYAVEFVRHADLKKDIEIESPEIIAQRLNKALHKK